MKSIVHAFHTILNRVSAPTVQGDFPTQFALRRFVKKFEIPESAHAAERKLKTFEQWREYDEGLRAVHLPLGEWYTSRLHIQKMMKNFRLGELTFTGGSQSEPLHGMQSIADKLLTHDWEVSPGCAELFVDLAVDDHALMKAAKIRMRRSLGAEGYRNEVKRIYRINHSVGDVRRFVLYFNLVERDHSRYSTVRKNNAIDRSIDLQPFINMLVQRAIGLGLKELIKSEFGLDLEVLQPVHGSMIRDRRFSTIDLRNASDSNTWSLCEFLFPKWFVNLLRKACPTYTEGLDGHFYVTKKISSMGNGFTFELMTLVLLATVRQLDAGGSVFGDDIVISTTHAPRLVKVLESAGWVVNVDKTFIDSSFRESCGYNYHDEFGYMRSYDFEYPETIGDCIVFANKCFLLGSIPFFAKLHSLLYRAIPKALRGPVPHGTSVGLTHEQDTCLDSHFFCKKYKPTSPPQLESLVSGLQWPSWGSFETYVYQAHKRFTRRHTIRMKSHALLYFAYMQAGTMSDIVLTGKGDWIKVGMITDGSRSFRIKALSCPT